MIEANGRYALSTIQTVQIEPNALSRNDAREARFRLSDSITKRYKRQRYTNAGGRLRHTVGLRFTSLKVD